MRKGQRIVLRQVTSLVPSTMHQQPHRQATRLVALGKGSASTASRQRNAEAWQELWRGRVVLVGADPRWQALADAAFFYLHTSTHPGSLSTHPFGLAQWHGYHYYYGHVMWDVGVVSLAAATAHESRRRAAPMLDYRSRSSEAARENARLNGRRGVQFPWESSPARGEESTPGLRSGGGYEHHVTADVAKAFARRTCTQPETTSSSVAEPGRCSWPRRSGSPADAANGSRVGDPRRDGHRGTEGAGEQRGVRQHVRCGRAPRSLRVRAAMRLPSRHHAWRAWPMGSCCPQTAQV